MMTTAWLNSIVIQDKDVTVRVHFLFDPSLGTTAFINNFSRKMYLNLPKMIYRAKYEEMSFDDFFALCISHELIHQILFDTEGDFASGQFDNICHNRYKNLRAWIGGVGNE